MGLTAEFKQSAGELVNHLMPILAMHRVLEPQISAQIDGLNLSEAQIQTITDNANSTVFDQNLNASYKTTGQSIAHTFTDTVAKSIESVSLCQFNDELFLSALTRTQEGLKSVINNMEVLLPSKSTENIVIEGYNQALVKTEQIIKNFSKTVPNAEKIMEENKVNALDGVDYIKPLPQNLLEM